LKFLIIMNERKLSKLQKEYRKFFLEKLSFYDVKSPADLTKEKKSVFFTEIKNEWAKYKILQKQKLEDDQANYLLNVKKLVELSKNKNIEHEKISTQEEDNETKAQILTVGDKSKQNTSKKKEQSTKLAQGELEKQIIKSEPNNEQSNDLKILFSPNNYFIQEEKYQYPVVKMPKQNNVLKLPRLGRSNQRGYKEYDFFNQMKLHISDIEITDNVHMVIPNYNKPYEPDIVLFDKKLNLYIDIEIDEPYDGYYRYPTHNYRAEDDFKQDDIRDLFFTESGWVVVRFTEKQVHKQPKECIDYIKNILNSIYYNEFCTKFSGEIENQWNENQCIQWQLNYVREKYLGIHSFYKRSNQKEVVVIDKESEPIESNIQRTQFEDIEKQYDKDLHKYFHPNDKTGNAEYISVTTLIERFFQFDILRYIQREAEKQNIDEIDFFMDFQTTREEAAILGTELHLQIENYFNKKPFDDSLIEFKYFLNFEKEKITPKELVFVEAEKKIYYSKFNIAGTVDCLFKSSNGKYVIVDWKRSKKLIVKGTNKPDKRGFQIDIEGLRDLTNSSYFRYCIQQNMYKYILEQEYNILISDMILAVFHENYSNYHTIKLPVMTNEIKIIFNSLNHKI
jgi:hypothetical protein